MVGGGIIDNSDDDGSDGVGGNNVYKGKVEPILVSLSDLYFDNKISVSDSRPSFCPAYISY